MDGFKYLKYSIRSRLRCNDLIYSTFKIVEKFFVDPQDSWCLCSRNKDICVEAYPASANSFMCTLLMCLNKDLNIAHHTHSIANIKIALRYDVPAIVIIRNPSDAISSHIARFHAAIEQSILDYIHFYKYVARNIDKLIVFAFEQVIGSTDKVIERIVKETKIELNYDNLEDIKQQVFLEMKNHVVEKDGNAERIALPSHNRELQKEQIKKKVCLAAGFEESNMLYMKIKAEIPKLK